ncbi:hypothetical protein [Natronobacterium texcoconense]|uniref:Uncharacterized protein n=1 Tax=Natronobacterium texcoconense TaxID=1095778 RepID=A0A1H1CRN8_NATTX|nr:hypothetical protein [Natronobacterium texcoconense]SDQ66870.1 hypothetical protein SAMN04489842_1503 [Natronobacterium texcoconense]
MDSDDVPRFDRPELLCDAIATLIDTLEEDDLLTEEEASDLRSQVYRSVDLGNHPEEELAK